QGKTALVTGASRGIGRAIALEFARQGIRRLILVSRNQQRLNAVATTIAEQVPAVEVVVLPIDLTQSVERVSIAIAQAWRDYGPVHLLVNCAGVAHQTPFLRSRPHQIANEIATNLMGTYTITRLIGRRMAALRQGTIVNVSSLMGKIGAPTMATYSATKFALVGFTQALRSELAPANVNVVALLPTLTDTDMARSIDRFRWVNPMTPDDVAIALIQGLKRDSSEILVGWQSHVAVWMSRIAPWLVERVIRWASPQPKRPASRPQASRSPVPIP
ncbi:MAG: SDR family NAD(P)-dependent oxidoreductase, partial [Merismopedia sp. SIO2A8]|nr:SDR family NAD(P)-dependent oxidoreductase [Merismopedia sp. SIO2A8]